MDDVLNDGLGRLIDAAQRSKGEYAGLSDDGDWIEYFDDQDHVVRRVKRTRPSS